MASASPPLHDVMETVHALTELMSGAAVSFSWFREFSSFCSLIAVDISLPISAASCQSGAFRCSNGQCIRSSYRCDKTRHCTDGSDETGCRKLILMFVNIYYDI